MKKILLLIGCIFLITGCKVEYNLNINNDLMISESVNMTGTEEFFDTYYKSSRLNVINMIFDDERKELLKENGYNYKIIENETPYVLVNKDYTNINDYVTNSVFFKQYFNNINVTDENGIISLKTEDFMPINPDSIERYNIAVSTIKITSSYKAVNHNASSYDEKTNTYTWYIEDVTKDFSIDFSYDTNQIYVPPKDEINWILIIMMIIFVIGIIVVYILNNKKQNNY